MLAPNVTNKSEEAHDPKGIYSTEYIGDDIPQDTHVLYDIFFITAGVFAFTIV